MNGILWKTWAHQQEMKKFHLYIPRSGTFFVCICFLCRFLYLHFLESFLCVNSPLPSLRAVIILFSAMQFYDQALLIFSNLALFYMCIVKRVLYALGAVVLKEPFVLCVWPFCLYLSLFLTWFYLLCSLVGWRTAWKLLTLTWWAYRDPCRLQMMIVMMWAQLGVIADLNLLSSWSSCYSWNFAETLSYLLKKHFCI